jgi:hypothetical protein
VHHGEDVLDPVLMPARTGGEEDVRVVQQTQGRRVPGAAAPPQLHEGAADAAGEHVGREARDAGQLSVPPPQEFRGRIVRSGPDQLARCLGDDGPVSPLEFVGCPPQLFQVGVEEVEGDAVVVCRAHGPTLGRLYRILVPPGSWGETRARRARSERDA